MKRLMLILIFVGACTTTEMADQALATRFMGKPSDEFFLQYGPPQSRWETKDGRIVYLWAERPMNGAIAFPTTATTTNFGYMSTTTVNPGSVVGFTVQCQVQVVTNKAGTILQIRAFRDSDGVMETSRCHEVFATAETRAKN